MEDQWTSDVHSLLSFHMWEMSYEEPPNEMTKDGCDDKYDSLWDVTLPCPLQVFPEYYKYFIVIVQL